MDGESTQERAEFELNLSFQAGRVRVVVPVPRGRMRVADFMPTLYALQEAISLGARRDAEQAGKTISCKAGCGACCRQLVPVSESEAVRLAELVCAMPEERRARIRARIEKALEVLERNGILPRLRALPREEAAAETLVLDYFRLGIPCPFLEAESCGIYADRPMICREYLVTSPAANCANPSPDNIDRVPLPAKPAKLVYRFEDGRGEDDARLLPLLLALAFADDRGRRSRPTYSAPEMFQNFLARISGGKHDPETP